MVVARAQILLEGALLGIWLASGSDVNLNGVHGSESASQAIVLWLLLLLLGRAGESMAVPLSMIGLSTHAPPGSLSDYLNLMFTQSLIVCGMQTETPLALSLFLNSARDVGLGVSGYAITTALQWILAYCLPRSFDETETSLISQGLSLAVQDSLMVLIRLMGNGWIPYDINIERSPVSVFWYALVFGMTLIAGVTGPVLVFWKRSTRTRQWMRLAFFLFAFSLTLSFILVPLMYSVLGENPFIWTIAFILTDTTRVFVISYLAFIMVLGIYISARLSPAQDSASLNWKRKYFHFLAIALFFPTMYLDTEFMHLSFSVALSSLLLFELVRLFDLEPWYPSRLDVFMRGFTNERDRGFLIVSHIYLLVGCALPLWLVSIVYKRHWLVFVGLCALGIGDSLASIIGKRYGKYHWPSCPKTFEGSCGFSLSLALIFGPLKYFMTGTYLTMNGHSVILLSTVLEALSRSNDNLIVPVFMLTGFLLCED